MSKVVNITVDALIYLLALIKSIRQIAPTLYAFQGNMPKDDKAKLLVSESGFLDHLQSSNIKMAYNSNKMRIVSGNNVDPDVLRDAIDFIKEGNNITKSNTRVLYNIIGEMMANASRHAYDESKNYTQKWLLFIEKSSEKIKFTLLDTGLSIPYTVNKKIFSDMFKDDCYMVKSALKGELRSKTGLPYRGKGLPEIHNAIIDDNVHNMDIISRKACCRLKNGADEISSVELKNELMGTLYYWELLINKEV